MSPETLRVLLSNFPRIRLGTLPTPLEPLENLTKAMAGPRLWIKRDDGLGPGMGGNKARKLEFLMAEALRQGKRRVITYGGLQSNHARMTAAVCAALDLEAHLFFFERRPARMTGNLLLNQLFDAHLHFIPFGGGGDATMTIETANRLVWALSLFRLGPWAYFMPVGGHNTTGCLGYVAAACELHEQVTSLGLDGRTTVITAAGTGGTLAGLLAGFALLESSVNVLAIDVGKLWKSFPASIANLAGALCQTLGTNQSFRPEDVPIIEREYVGPGYARPTIESKEAIQSLARSEGILLDPVYTGKAFAGLLDLVRGERFQSGEHVIFLHTGGAPSLWLDSD